MIAQAIPYMIEVRPAPRATGIRPPLHIVVIRDKPCPKAFASPTLIRVNDPPKLTEVSDLLYRVRVAEKLASGAIFESQAAEQALIVEQNRLRSVAILYGALIALAFLCVAIVACRRTSQPRDDRGRFVRKDTP
jgi:hypothetical protein